MKVEFTQEEPEMTESEMLAQDDIILELGRRILEEEQNTIGIVNMQKFEQIQFTYNVAKFLTRGQNAKVSYKLNQPFKSMGSVTISGKNIVIDQMEWFARAAEFASNTEMYTLVDGTVKITFTFHGLVNKI